MADLDEVWPQALEEADCLMMLAIRRGWAPTFDEVESLRAHILKISPSLPLPDSELLIAVYLKAFDLWERSRFDVGFSVKFRYAIYSNPPTFLIRFAPTTTTPTGQRKFIDFLDWVTWVDWGKMVLAAPGCIDAEAVLARFAALLRFPIARALWVAHGFDRNWMKKGRADLGKASHALRLTQDLPGMPFGVYEDALNAAAAALSTRGWDPEKAPQLGLGAENEKGVKMAEAIQDLVCSSEFQEDPLVNPEALLGKGALLNTIVYRDLQDLMRRADRLPRMTEAIAEDVHDAGQGNDCKAREQAFVPVSEPSAEAALQSKEEDKQEYEALSEFRKKLSPLEAMVFERLLADESPAEIAENLRFPPKKVYNLLRRIREKVKKFYPRHS